MALGAFYSTLNEEESQCYLDNKNGSKDEVRHWNKWREKNHPGLRIGSKFEIPSMFHGSKPRNFLQQGHSKADPILGVAREIVHYDPDGNRVPSGIQFDLH